MSGKADNKKYGIARSRMLMPIIVDISSFSSEEGMDFEQAREICAEFYKNLAEKIEAMNEDNFAWIVENNITIMKEIARE